MLLAESLFGWYLGLVIAFTIIVVVVAVVASILTLAGRIVEQAPVAADGLNAVQKNTALIPAVSDVNAAGLAILAACQKARAALGG
ncbi:MAG: hypothetical protein ACRDZ7_06795 [Acidimicrobiia bacterium]